MDKTSESSQSPLSVMERDILCADTLCSSFSCTLWASLISHFFAPLFSFSTVHLHPRAARRSEMALPDSTSPSSPFASIFTHPFLSHTSSSVQPLARYLAHFHNSRLPSSSRKSWNQPEALKTIPKIIQTSAQRQWQMCHAHPSLANY